MYVSCLSGLLSFFIISFFTSMHAGNMSIALSDEPLLHEILIVLPDVHLETAVSR